MLCDTCSFGLERKLKRKFIVPKEARVQGNQFENTITCLTDKWTFDKKDNEVIECSGYHQTSKSKENLDG